MTDKFTRDLNLKAYPNTLSTGSEGEYLVKVDTQSTPLTQDDIADAVAARLGEEPSKVKAIVQTFAEEVVAAVTSGYCVSTATYYARPVASGVVTGEELAGPVDRDKVKVYASLSQGPAMKEGIAKAKLNYYRQPAPVGPRITGMANALQAGRDDTRVPLAGGDMAVITGSGLKVVGDDPSVGITLTKADDPATSFFIPASHISPNLPKKLQFVLPEGIPEGEWRVKVTTQYIHGNYRRTQKPRSFFLPHPCIIGSWPEGGDSGTEGGEEEEAPFG